MGIKTEITFESYVVACKLQGKPIIPDMTHKLSKAWDQPGKIELIFPADYSYCKMTDATLQRLHDYSHSQPSGVYAGKMWRSTHTEGDMKKHFLHWFSDSDKPDECLHHRVPIEIIK